LIIVCELPWPRTPAASAISPAKEGLQWLTCPKAKRSLVELLSIGGEEYLFYKAFPITVGIVQGTMADPEGNITMEREALTLEALAIAMAVRNSGGIVIVQGERLADSGSLNARQVKIPGILVDCVVVAEQPEHHWQTFATPFSAAFCGEIRAPMSSIPPMKKSERKIIARHAAMELKANSVASHAGRDRQCRSGREDHRPDHAHGGTRRGGRDPCRRAQLRGGHERRRSSTNPTSSTSTTGAALMWRFSASLRRIARAT
jgi:hypothetical protein